MATITAADASVYLTVRNFFPVPQKIEGFAMDDSVATENVQEVEAQMGVDGKLSFGYTPQPSPMVVTLQADSPSMPFFDTVINAQKAGRTVYIFDGLIQYPGPGTKTTMTKGAITEHTPASSAKKVLQPRTFKITFESTITVPV